MACLGAGTVLAASGTVHGAMASSVNATGPPTATAGDSVELHFKGYAAKGVNRLRIWLDDRTCAASAVSVGGRSGLRQPTDFRVRRRFRRRLTVEHTSKGTHVVCAYLLQRVTGNTAAEASWRYVTS